MNLIVNTKIVFLIPIAEINGNWRCMFIFMEAISEKFTFSHTSIYKVTELQGDTGKEEQCYRVTEL